MADNSNRRPQRRQIDEMTHSPATREADLRRALSSFRAPAVCELDRWRSALAITLCAGNLEHSEQIVTDACTQIPPVCVLDDVLAPTMHHIGSLWSHNQITIADEHQATEVCRRLLNALAPSLALAPPRSRERIVFVTPTCERHTTGLMMAKAVLYGAGYDTVLLTEGMSEEALRAELLRYQPAVVALSLTMPYVGDFAATLLMIRETLPEVQLITGGAAGRSFPPSIAATHIERLEHLPARLDSLIAQHV